ncbi:MAG: PaaI family thioesterase [Candidatus Hydrogenedentes bacterium]|nr:PaaI family thioesterase [Candidatus Hydrogenedentota bacterium]
MNKTFLPTSEHCFVCGEANPAGLGTRFYVENDVVKMPLTAKHHHCGYPNRIHGGIVAAAVDECMGWAAARAIQRMCVTGDLSVRYIRPVTLDKAFTVCAEVLRSNRRLVHCAATIIDEHGEVHVRGEGRFLPLTVEQTLRVDDNLLYKGGEERVFAPLREGEPENGGAGERT